MSEHMHSYYAIFLKSVPLHLHLFFCKHLHMHSNIRVRTRYSYANIEQRKKRKKFAMQTKNLEESSINKQNSRREPIMIFTVAFVVCNCVRVDFGVDVIIIFLFAFFEFICFYILFQVANATNTTNTTNVKG
jgi:hypothetical protein